MIKTMTCRTYTRLSSHIAATFSRYVVTSTGYVYGAARGSAWMTYGHEEINVNKKFLPEVVAYLLADTLRRVQHIKATKRDAACFNFQAFRKI